jgi:hypothetical protein
MPTPNPTATMSENSPYALSVLLASRSDFNESKIKEMHSCLANELGRVACYFPTAFSHKKFSELFSRAAETEKERDSMQAENTALRAALEAVKEWNDGDLDSYGNSEYSFRAEFIRAALAGKGVQS